MTGSEHNFSFTFFLKTFPIIGLVLVISYQVGYFQAVGFQFFSILSISDHISLFLKLSPITIIITLLAYIIAHEVNVEQTEADNSDDKDKKVIAKTGMALIWIVTLINTSFIHFWESILAIIAIIIWLNFVKRYLLPKYWEHLKLSSFQTKSIYGVPVIIFFMFFLGSELAAKIYDDTEPNWKICNTENCKDVTVLSIFQYGVLYKDGDDISFGYNNNQMTITNFDVIKDHKTPMQDIGEFLGIDFLITHPSHTNNKKDTKDTPTASP